jgi:hypothetical protein
MMVAANQKACLCAIRHRSKTNFSPAVVSPGFYVMYCIFNTPSSAAPQTVVPEEAGIEPAELLRRWHSQSEALLSPSSYEPRTPAM